MLSPRIYAAALRNEEAGKDVAAGQQKSDESLCSRNNLDLFPFSVSNEYRRRHCCRLRRQPPTRVRQSKSWTRGDVPIFRWHRDRRRTQSLPKKKHHFQKKIVVAGRTFRQQRSNDPRSWFIDFFVQKKFTRMKSEIPEEYRERMCMVEDKDDVGSRKTTPRALNVGGGV